MQAVLYVVAVILLAVAALPVGSPVKLALLGAACALLAYAWPVLAALG